MITRPLLAIALASTLILGWPRASVAGANQSTDSGTPLRWNSQIRFVINPGGVPGFGGELSRLVVAGAIRDSFRAWTQVPGAAISFTDSGLTNQTNRVGGDGISLVTFQDSNFNFGPGVLGVAVTQFNPSTGVISDADILFNRQLPGGDFFSPVGADGSVDLIAVAIHEIGHLLGLDHSGVSSSIMNPVAGGDNFGVYSRTIHSDDAITVASLYPLPTFAPATGTISGVVRTSGGTPVRSAHVVALSEPGGVPVASQLSGASGQYSVQGLPPGSYRVLVEPLDGPITLADLPGFFGSGSSDFSSTMVGGFGSPTTFQVAAGQGVVADVTLPPNPASKVNVDLMGVFDQSTCGGGAFLGPTSLYLPRGRSFCLVATDETDATDTVMTFSSPDITRLGETQPVPGVPARRQQVSLAPASQVGPSNLALANANSTSVMPGGIVVTVNPQAATPLRDGAGFGTALGPGGFISIFGADLAERTESASAVPLPTNLGGVSVKIGNRFAPLFFVSPGQINALVPFEVSGTVILQVVTGPEAGGNALVVNLSPTAPGIFSVNQSGAGQGAILNVDNSFVAPAGSIPGAQAHPARPGDVIVIFASGLGPVTPAAPSGLDAGAAGTTIPQLVNAPTVRIGGQVAALDFAGLAPTFVGLYQVNARIPANVTPGNSVPVEITTFQGQTSNTVTIAVSP